LEELVQAGWEIGSHSVHHQPLPHLNQKRLLKEVTDSHKILKEMTGNDTSTFSYPFGMQNSRVQKAIKDAGFKFGCRNISWNPHFDNLLSIPRIPVYKFDTLKTLQKKLELAASLFEKLKLIVLNWPARFTPLYQILFRKHLFLEK
jgi:peptidoglycan/xylan/chitin deacetylase (PgdA/CDA1 family)